MQTKLTLPLKIAQLAEREHLFTLPPKEERRVEQLFGELQHSLDLIAKTPVRGLTRKLAPSGAGVVKQLYSLLKIFQNFRMAVCGYESYRMATITDSLYVSLLLSHLRSLHLPLAQISETTLYSRSLPYEELERLPEWVDYLSHLYAPTLSSETLRRQLTLSKRIQQQLRGEDKVRVALMDLSTILSAKAPIQEISTLLQEGVEAPTNITIYRGTSQGEATDENPEQRISERFHQLEEHQKAEGTAQKNLSNFVYSRLFQKPKAEFDIGYYLAKLLEPEKEDNGDFFTACKNTLAYLSLIPRIDALFPRLSQIVFSKLRSTLGQFSRNHQTTTIQALAQIKETNPLLVQEPIWCHHKLRVISEQIEESKQTLLTPARLHSLIQQAFVHTDSLLPLALVRMSMLVQRTAENQLLRKDNAFTRPFYHPNTLKLLLHTQSTLSALLPTHQTTSLHERNKAKKVRRKKRVHKAPRAASLLAVQEEKQQEETNLASVVLPAVAAPVVSMEAKQLAQLAQMPIRIKRHPRTYNRPEFADDRRNQALHYLPPQLVQMLLQKDNPFIAKYVQWKENDPNFDGNHSARATVLCHDRDLHRVYVGELSVGVTPNGLVYHVYINPYANPLEGRQHLEQSVVDRPPNDLLEEEEGFDLVGDCQLSHDELLHTIDVADREKNCLYRIFLQ